MMCGLYLLYSSLEKKGKFKGSFQDFLNSKIFMRHELRYRGSWR